MSLHAAIHTKAVTQRRVRVLVETLSAMLPRGLKVLDVGCGDGLLASLLMSARPDLAITGVDVLLRPQPRIPVDIYDGKRLPFADDSFDAVMLVDVLHHTDDPTILLAEAKRVARRNVVIKDHCQDGLLAAPTLRFMDWFGNVPYGVVLPYNYWPESRWRQSFADFSLTVESWVSKVGLYPWPASLLFDRDLHFVARLASR